MKPNPWLLPVLAAIICGGWIFSRKQSAAMLEREITVLTGRIREVRESDALEPRTGASGAASAVRDHAVDWKAVAGRMAGARDGGIHDIRESVRMQRLLMDMTAEELTAHLDEISQLDIEPETLDSLRGMIFGALIDKDPELALERMAGGPGGDKGMQWRMGGALASWAKSSPAAAAAWLDRQAAAGRFESSSLDGKNSTRVFLERSLVGVLMDSDPAAAAARLKTLPEVQREELFEHGSFYQNGRTDPAAFASLLRESLPAEKSAAALARTAASLVQSGDGGAQRVDDFITRSGATRDETSAIVSKVMDIRILTHDPADVSGEIQRAREWGTGHAPGAIAGATGAAIANWAGRSGNFTEASRLVLLYNLTDGNDATLAAFLKQPVTRHRGIDTVRPLIKRIEDPAVRDEILALPEYRPADPP